MVPQVGYAPTTDTLSRCYLTIRSLWFCLYYWLNRTESNRNLILFRDTYPPGIPQSNNYYINAPTKGIEPSPHVRQTRMQKPLHHVGNKTKFWQGDQVLILRYRVQSTMCYHYTITQLFLKWYSRTGSNRLCHFSFFLCDHFQHTFCYKRLF